MYKPPKKIYLQIDPEGKRAIDWLDGVTWCQDKINDNDVEYIRADLVASSPDASKKPNKEG